MLVPIEKQLHNFLISSEYTANAGFRITLAQPRLVRVLGFSETKSHLALVLV
jgi:hypothetical protein